MDTHNEYDKLTPAQKGKLTRLLNKLDEQRVSPRSEFLFDEYRAKLDEKNPEAKTKIEAIQAEAQTRIELLNEQIEAIEAEVSAKYDAIRKEVNAYAESAYIAWNDCSSAEWKAFREKREKTIQEFYAEHLGVNA